MELPSDVALPADAMTPSHPWWRAAAKAMARWHLGPTLTDETARLYYRSKHLHGRASATLLGVHNQARALLDGAR